jgi:oligopeptide transport system substrate-binding protein
MKLPNILKMVAAAGVLALMSSAASAVTLNLHNGGDPRTLDPAKESGNWEDRPTSDIMEGMMTIDPKGEPTLGQAASFEVSPDGLVYTFKLRDDILWSDGTPVTAKNFVDAFERLQNPATAAQYASLSYFVKGAEDYNKGTNKDPASLGVVALDDKTVQYTLNTPTPYFLGALGHQSMYPVPSHVVAQFGEDWSKVEHIVGNGAYKLVEWVPGSFLRAVKNDKYYDAANVKIDEVKYFVIEDSAAALARYRAGELDILTDFPTDQLQLVQEQFPGQAPLSPILSFYYYAMNEEDPALKDPEIRKALSMAVNREAITDQILGTGDKPTYSLVPLGTANYEGTTYQPDWVSMSYDDRVAAAAKIMAAKGYSASNPLPLQIRYNNTPTHQRIAIAISSMWEAIGVKGELLVAETGPHYTALENGEFQVGRAGWGMDYNDPSNALDLLITGTMQEESVVDGKTVPAHMNWQNNFGRYSNPKYDELNKQARTETDLIKRAALLHEAEKIAGDESAIIPIYTQVTKWVISPKIGGYVDNPVERHFSRYFTKSE